MTKINYVIELKNFICFFSIFWVSVYMTTYDLHVGGIFAVLPSVTPSTLGYWCLAYWSSPIVTFLFWSDQLCY